MQINFRVIVCNVFDNVNIDVTSISAQKISTLFDALDEREIAT
jgi:hypothetical protein